MPLQQSEQELGKDIVALADGVLDRSRRALAQAITLIEWPDRLGRRLPADRLEVRLSYGKAADARSVVLAGYGSWHRRLAAVADEIRTAAAAAAVAGR